MKQVLSCLVISRAANSKLEGLKTKYFLDGLTWSLFELIKSLVTIACFIYRTFVEVWGLLLFLRLEFSVYLLGLQLIFFIRIRINITLPNLFSV